MLLDAELTLRELKFDMVLVLEVPMLTAPVPEEIVSEYCPGIFNSPERTNIPDPPLPPDNEEEFPPAPPPPPPELTTPAKPKPPLFKVGFPEDPFPPFPPPPMPPLPPFPSLPAPPPPPKRLFVTV